MKPIEKILVCVDLSEYSVMTIAWAMEIARGTHAQITIFNVINQMYTQGAQRLSIYHPDSVDVPKFNADLKENRDKELRQLIKDNFPEDKSKFQILIKEGYPSEAILETAESQGADLIVIGNKGRGNISRTLFGSVAEKVFRHSPIPVVSVRDKPGFKRDK